MVIDITILAEGKTLPNSEAELFASSSCRIAKTAGKEVV